MNERHYRLDDRLESWMAARKVTERDVIVWLRGPSLFKYVQRKLRALLRKAA